MRRGVIVAIALLGFTVPAAPQDAAANLDFESGAPGAPPPGWRVSAAPGTTARILTENPARGRQAAELSTPPAGGNMRVELDATPYRGVLVLLEAQVHSDTSSFLALSAEYAPGQPLIFTGATATAVTWKKVRIAVRIPATARRLLISAGVQGSGKIWLDDVSLHAVTPAELGFESARPLTARGLANLAAFTRLLGIVRFFHPSDQAARADWNSFAIAGVRKVEGARDAQELAAMLQALFAPLAPTLRVAAGEAPAPAIPACNACAQIGWTHHGAGLNPANPVYRSERTVRARAEPALRLDLGGGVTARMPLTLPRDAGGTLPHAPMPVPDFGKPAPFAPHGDDRSTRLADVALAWTVFQHFYPYFDVVKTDWDAELPKALRRAAADANAEAFEQTLQLLVAALKDGHGDANYILIPYQPPLEWNIVEGKLAVTRIDAGHPSGLRQGDVILAINGRDTAALLAEARPRASGSTPQWRQLRTLRLLWPRTPDPMVLTVQRGRDAPIAVSVVPQVYGSPPVRPSLENYAEVKPGIRYVDLSRVTDADMAKSMDDLVRARAVIFDMRGYPLNAASRLLSHLSGHVLRSASFKVPRITRPDRRDMSFPDDAGWQLQPIAPRIAGKFVFLTGGGAISYAESVMGLVEREKLGTIVGETTAGTNGNVNPFTLPGDYRLLWTGLRVVKADGTVHQGVGVSPDVRVKPTLAGLAAGRDEVLEKGIEVALKEIGR